MAAGELLSPRPGPRRRVAAAIFASLGVSLLHSECLVSGYMARIPHFYMLSVPLNYLLGPLIYEYLLRGLERPVPSAWKMYGIAPLLSALLLLPVWLQGSEAKRERIAAVGNGDYPGYEEFVFMGGLIYFTFFLVLTLREVRPVRFSNLVKADPAVRTTAILGGAGIILNIGGMIAVPFGLPLMNRGLVLGIVGVILGVYLLGRRYPQFFHELTLAVNQEKYKHSQIKGVDLERVSQRLDDIMSREKAYREDDLALAGLAERVGLTPHQLSEYFNNHLKVNFAAYVNGFRVREAAELLLREPDRTVLSIAYETGFNSKSNFNTAFARVMKISPTLYRKSGGKATPNS